MPQAKTANFYLDKGSDWRVELELRGVDNRPIILYGMKFASEACFIMRDNIKTRIDCTIMDPEMGIVILSIPPNRSERLPYGEYIYNVEMLDCMSLKHRVLQGKILIEDETTIIY